MKSKDRIMFLLGKADDQLETALNLASTLPEAWINIHKAMETMAFCAGMADARAIWKSQRESALAIEAIDMVLLALVQSMIRGLPDPNWTDTVVKIRDDIQTLVHRVIPVFRGFTFRGFRVEYANPGKPGP